MKYGQTISKFESFRSKLEPFEVGGEGSEVGVGSGNYFYLGGIDANCPDEVKP